MASKTQVESSWAERVTGLEHAEGFISFYWDYKKGRLLLEISELDQEFLYLRALATGVGSVDVRTLDRGTIAESALVTFRKTGPKVLLVQKNLAFRSTADNKARITSRPVASLACKTRRFECPPSLPSE